MIPNTQYIVTKPSDDKSFFLGDIIVLKDDGRIWIGDDYIESKDISAAITGMEYKLLTTAAPNHLNGVALETYKLLQQVADLQNPRFNDAAYMDLIVEMDRLADLAQELLAKIEGGGE